MSTAFTCSTCDGEITADEIASGLAVRVDGKLVCALCVDLLPGRAQLAINTQRALKGLGAITYRVTVPAHPDHQRYTFTTTANVILHRRTVHGGDEFPTPPMPRSGPPRILAPRAPRSASRRPIALVATVVAATLLLGTVALVIPHGGGGGSGGSASQPASGHEPTRADYPADPALAWLACSTDRACPPELAEVVKSELRARRSSDLDEAEHELTAGNASAARAKAERAKLPDDPAFADLRTRARALVARAAAASAPAITAVKPATAPDTVAEPPVPANPATPVADAAPVGGGQAAAPHWAFTVDELLAASGADGWNAGGELAGAAASAERELPEVAAGHYQVWASACNPAAHGRMTVLIDGQEVGRLDGAKCTELLWRPVRASIALTAGAHLFSIKVNGTSWRVARMYLTGADAPSPDALSEAPTSPWPLWTADAADTPPAQATAVEPKAPPADPPKPPAVDPPKPPKPVTTAKPAAPAAPARELAVWKRTVLWPQLAKEEPLDGTIGIPSPWPSGAEPFMRSQRLSGQKGVQTLALSFAKAEVDGGGVVLVLHRARADRHELAASVEYPMPGAAATPPGRKPVSGLDEEFEAQPLAPLSFGDSADWQVFTIRFGDLSRCADRLWLRLSDTSDFGADRGFLLGKVVTVAHSEPTPADLGLMAPPLIAPDVVSSKDQQRRLVALLSQACSHRPSKHWNEPRSFDPHKFALLITNPDDQWRNQVRKQLQRVFALKDEPGGFIKNLALGDGFWAEKQFKAATPLVDPEEANLALICLNGEETGCSLKDPDALDHWIRDLAGELLAGDTRGKRGGMVPVVVVGRTVKADAAQQALIDAAWGKVRETCLATGMPLIDIREAQNDHPKHDVREISAQLLSDGFKTLVYQIGWTQRFVR
jgi:hypothetical protein